MRYKTFRALVILGLLGTAGVSFYAFQQYQDQAKRQEDALRRVNEDLERYRQAQRQQEAPAAATASKHAAEPNATPVAANAPTNLPAGFIALRPMDVEILAVAAANISGDKLKDAVKGRAWKVNLYRDAGESQVNRAKVDLDRDDKWDEKWTWKDGRITREVASNDDETYNWKFFLEKDGKAWLPR